MMIRTLALGAAIAALSLAGGAFAQNAYDKDGIPNSSPASPNSLSLIKSSSLLESSMMKEEGHATTNCKRSCGSVTRSAATWGQLTTEFSSRFPNLPNRTSNLRYDMAPITEDISMHYDLGLKHP